MNKNNKIQWYLVQCKPREELRAQENLSNQAIDNFLPTLEVEKVIRGKRQKKIEALFPGYLFVALPEDGTGWSKIRSTRGIRDFVKFAGIPAKVPGLLLKELKLIHQQQTKQKIEAPQTGDKVTISEGPFKDLEGVFKAADGSERCILLLNVLGKETELTVNNSLVKKSEK